MTLRVIIDYLWPIAEHNGGKQQFPEEDKELVLESLRTNSEASVKLVLETSIRAHEDEDRRRSVVEAKAASVIGFGGVIVTLIVTLSIWIIEQKPVYHFPGLALLFISLVYFVASILRALLALERAAFHRVTARDVAAASGEDPVAVSLELAAMYITSTVKNFNTINRKVEFVVLAHRFFKRGIVTLSAGGLLLMFGHVIPKILELLRATAEWSCSYLAL